MRALAKGWAVVLVALPALALGPFERNHPQVQEGLEAYEKGDYQQALEKFEAAKKALPRSAAVEFNRGNALFKLGRYDEARDAYRRVTELDDRSLQSRDHFNLGNAWVKLDDERQAITEYRRALRLDPSDDRARHNLEVLLRKLPPPNSGGPDGGTPDGGQDGGRPDAGQGDGGQDGGRDGGQGDAGQGDAGQDGGSDGGADAGQDGGGQSRPGGDGGTDGGGDGGDRGEGDRQRDAGGESRPSQGSDGGGSPEEGRDGGQEQPDRMMPDGGLSPMSRKEAEKLLDSLKNSEKNLQLWRFQQKKQPKRPNAKDW